MFVAFQDIGVRSMCIQYTKYLLLWGSEKYPVSAYSINCDVESLG